MSFLLKVKELAFSVDIVEAQQQAELTQCYIYPILSDLFTDIKAIRHAFDRQFLKQHKLTSKPQPLHGIKSIDKYPTGYCEDIRNGVFEVLKQHPILLKMQEKGIIFKKVYVILKACYFQNGMQLGNLWIDVANDTVNPDEPPIYYKNISDLNYTNLSDYDTYGKVIEQYLNIRIYPNTLLPKIAPRFPIFALDTEGVCHLLNHQEILLYKDITKQFALSDTFFKGHFSTRQLPVIYQELIVKQLYLLYKQQISFKQVLSLTQNTPLLQQKFNEEIFERAVTQDALDFYFYFQMCAIRPPASFIEVLRQQQYLPMPHNKCL